MFHKQMTVALAIAVGLSVGAATAHADYLKGDPRKCPARATPQNTPDKPAQCAREAAKVTLLSYMRAHVNGSWSNPTTCRQASPPSLLIWQCSFGTGTAVVRFRALSTGWRRVVTLTMNP